MSDDDDFEEQLRQEAIQKAKEEAADDTESYKDKDGVEYEWDSLKRAWFPKIDEDFIANYQMNYGCSTTEANTSTTADAGKSESKTDSSQVAPTCADDAYKQYYNYYNSCYTTAGTTGDSTTTTASNEGGQILASPSSSESQELPERSEEYIDYCRDYYKFYHGKLNEEEDFDYCLYYEYYSQYTSVDDSEEQQGGDGSAEGDGSKDKNGKKSKKGATQPGEKRKREDPSWFEMDQERNTNVYVSGVHEDVTDDDFIELMSKYGMIMHDPFTRRPKAKLYKDEEGKNKGDGRCCFIKVESVDLALQILDGSEYKGETLHVERANFSVKGDYNPKLRKKLSNKQKRKLKLRQEKLFDWRPDALPGERKKSDKVIILKNVFNPVDFEKDPASIQEIRSDMRLECLKFGEVRKVTVYDRHPDGIATVAFKEPEEADTCKEALNGRWFGGKQLSAETWDGKAKFDIKESEQEREARLKKWETFLETGEASEASKQMKKDEASETKQKDVDAAETTDNTDAEMKTDVEIATVSTDGDKTAENTDTEMKKDVEITTVSTDEDKRAMEVDEGVASS